jgi:putative Mn2+ efflux pump MntP
MSLIVFIIAAAILATLGLKFFNTSVKQEEEQKGWDE